MSSIISSDFVSSTSANAELAIKFPAVPSAGLIITVEPLALIDMSPN